MKKTWQVQERLTKSVIPHSLKKDLRSCVPAFRRSGSLQNVAGAQERRNAGLYHFLYGANV